MAKILFATTAAGVKFYPVTITDAVVHIDGNDQKKLSEVIGDLEDAIDAIDYSGKADKVSGATNGNFAGLDSNGNLTDSGKKAADFDEAGAAATAEQNAKDYADGLASNYDAAGAADTAEQNAKDYADGLIAGLDASESQTAGADGLALSVTEVDGVITGISGSIAANTYDAHGAAATAKSEVIGASTDASSADTINAAKKKAEEEAAAVLGTASDAASANTVYGAKAYADALVAGGIIYKGTVDGTNGLPATGYKKGDYYKVAAAGTYAGHVCQVGDALIANKDYTSGATASADWDMLQGSVAVTDEGASLVIGTSTKVAEVEGVSINVTQVEDMTKIEAVAVADTTEYADVTSLFTAPAGE